MKTCKNCYWYDNCEYAGQRCEYYDPIDGAENITMREYHEYLKERHREYQDIVKEQQDIPTDEV